MIKPIELIGLAAGIFEMMALLGLAKRYKEGFILGIIGNILWMTYAVISNSGFGLYIVCPTAFFLNIFGYINWRRYGKANTIYKKSSS